MVARKKPCFDWASTASVFTAFAVGVGGVGRIMDADLRRTETLEEKNGRYFRSRGQACKAWQSPG
ncbi:exported hypothetical protein [Agrobacterium deltaense RV3]|nr:exported hypothetical protein [Agrobacterium deltaense RV3]